jgi:hypothetical protein
VLIRKSSCTDFTKLAYVITGRRLIIEGGPTTVWSYEQYGLVKYEALIGWSVRLPGNPLGSRLAGLGIWLQLPARRLTRLIRWLPCAPGSCEKVSRLSPSPAMGVSRRHRNIPSVKVLRCPGAVPGVKTLKIPKIGDEPPT